MTETIGGYIEWRSLVEIKNELGSRGVVSEAPMPTYGYMGKDEFYNMIKDADMINDWAMAAFGGLIHTDMKCVCAKEESRPYAK